MQKVVVFYNMDVTKQGRFLCKDVSFIVGEQGHVLVYKEDQKLTS